MCPLKSLCPSLDFWVSVDSLYCHLLLNIVTSKKIIFVKKSKDYVYMRLYIVKLETNKDSKSYKDIGGYLD